VRLELRTLTAYNIPVLWYVILYGLLRTYLYNNLHGVLSRKRIFINTAAKTTDIWTFRN